MTCISQKKWVKLSELRAGDSIEADAMFTCLRPGQICKVRADGDDLYVRCEDGAHFLDLQVGIDGDTIVGFSRVEDTK